MSPGYVTGFIEGEGCFCLFIRNDRQKRKGQVTSYKRWEAVLAIHLREDDRDLLKKIKDYFKCGHLAIVVSKQSRSKGFMRHCHWQVRNIRDLTQIIIPHFERYPLYGKKKKDFNLWKEAVYLLFVARQRQVTKKFQPIEIFSSEHKRLEEIREQLRSRLSGGQYLRKIVSSNSMDKTIVKK